MYAVKAFLGLENKPGVRKQMKRETEDIIKFLFLVVFACAYAYLPSSVSYSKEYIRPVPKKKTVRIASMEVSPKRARYAETRHMKGSAGKESRKQKCHYLDEPMCKLLRNVRYSKVNSRKCLKKSILPYVFRAPNQINMDDEKDVFFRDMSDRNRLKGTENENPNSNVDSSTINVQPVMLSPKKQWSRDVVFPKKVMNPNSVKRLKDKSSSCWKVGSKKNNDTTPPVVLKDEKTDHEEKPKNYVQPEISPSQQQQDEQGGIYKALRQIEQQNQKLELSVLENQERVTQIRLRNDHLQECVIEKEEQLQAKDDLILSLQMQMMNYETVSGIPVDIEACASRIKLEHKDEISRVKRTWLNREFETEKRIGNLVDALEREKERVKVLNSKAVGSEGQLWTEQHETDNQHQPGSPLKTEVVERVGRLMSSQQQQIETREPQSQRLMELNTKVDSPRSEIKLLKERNRELELQLSQSDKVIGELSGEKRELEFVKAQLTRQLEQEPGRENNDFNKTQAQHQAEPGQRDTLLQISKMVPRPKKLKLLSMSRLLSCRKADIDRTVNSCEKGRKRVLNLTRSPELGQP